MILKLQFLLFILFLSSNCSFQNRPTDDSLNLQTERETPNMNKNTVFSGDNCQWISGEWKFYERNVKVKEDYCADGKPCGLSRPLFSLSCEDEKIVGKTLAIYDSKKGEAIFAPIVGYQVENKIILSIGDTPKCKQEYSLTKVTVDSMSGTLKYFGCGTLNNLEERVLALRNK